MTPEEIKSLEAKIRDQVRQQMQDDFLRKCIIDHNQEYLNQLRSAIESPDAGLVFHLISNRSTHISRRLALDYAITCAYESQRGLVEWLEGLIVEFPDVFGKDSPSTPPEDGQKACTIS